MIVFDFIVLIGLITLLGVFVYLERKDVKKSREKYFECLTNSIATGVYIGMERWSIVNVSMQDIGIVPSARTLRSAPMKENVRG